MTAFSAEWLALREPADAAARSLSLTKTLGARLPSSRELSILDLGAGTGSNVRFLAEHFPARQHWALVDHDRHLLGQVPGRTGAWAEARGSTVTRDADGIVVCGAGIDCRLATRELDLFASVHDDSLFERRALVTAAALLDLVSERWLDALALQCAKQRACVLFALTYDGRVECLPSEPEDETIRAFVNRHQHTKKGFGAALGPDAISAADECLTRAGYEVRRESSDWRLEPESAELQRQLIDGWADAARDIAPDRAASIEHWRARRRAHIDARRSRIVVGHEDLAAWPTKSDKSRHP